MECWLVDVPQLMQEEMIEVVAPDLLLGPLEDPSTADRDPARAPGLEVADRALFWRFGSPNHPPRSGERVDQDAPEALTGLDAQARIELRCTAKNDGFQPNRQLFG